MFRNYLSAALGNLSRNWLYASVTIVGLAVSFATAIVIGLYLRDEYSYETFLPGYQSVYRVETSLILPGEKPTILTVVHATAAALLKVDFPQVRLIARATSSTSLLKKGDVPTEEPVLWADPGFFKLLPYPVLAGDPDAALEAPDGLVLTRQAARKYFGQDRPIGRTLLVNVAPDGFGLPIEEELGGFHPMRVMAVLKDIPSNTHLSAQVFAAARAPFSVMSIIDRHPSPYNTNTMTYLRLRPGASADTIQAGLKAFVDRHYPVPGNGPSNYRYRLSPLRGLHFSSPGLGLNDVLRPPGDQKVDAGVAAVGAMIVVIAAINFITLMTARAARRAVEVGIRKAVGARRRDLVLQFMGEAMIYVLIAMVLAVAGAELSLPYVNAFLQRTLTFDYLSDPRVGGAVAGAALLTTLLAGAYPSLALSAFRPASALKGGATQPYGSARVRQVLVVGQFAILIGLIVMTGTIYRQTSFALHDALKLDTSQVISMNAPCRSAFRQEVEGLRGVKAVACGSFPALGLGASKTVVLRRDRTMQTISEATLDVGLFELQGLRPIAGRFFSPAHGEDMVLEQPGAGVTVQPSIVLNQSGARVLGFAHPAAAVGKRVSWIRWAQAPPGVIPHDQTSEIVGVVPDFSLGSIRTAIQPTLYYVDPQRTRFLIAKLDGQSMPGTLRSIDRAWRATGHLSPAAYVFENRAVQDLYRDVITQGIAIAVLAGLAIFIACLGLFALAAFTTERRTKEIGVRKAMGAGTGDVVKLLLWQFTQPVLWANLIAWPAAWWAMNRWLQGFAYRVDLPAWLFAAATGLAIVIALITVSTHAWLVARAKPVSALRYE